MPTIPDLQTLQRRVPQPIGRVVPLRGIVDYSHGAQEIGQAVGEARNQSDNFDVARAKSSLLQAHVAAINELDGNDYTKFEENYRKRMDVAVGDASKFIKTPSRQSEFAITSQDFLTHGLEEVHRHAEDTRIKVGQGNLLETIAGNSESAANSKDPASAIESIHLTNDAIRGAVDGGIIDPARGFELSQKSAESMAMLRIRQMPSLDQQYAVLTGTQKPSLGTVSSLYPDEQPQMQALLNHHNQAVANGKVVTNKNGSQSSLLTITTEDITPGKTTIIPTVWNGKIVSPDVAIQKARASKVSWPTFNSDAEAQAADARLHEHFKGTQSLADFLTPETRQAAIERTQSEIVSQYNLEEKMRKDAIDKSMLDAMNAIDQDKKAHGGVSSLAVTDFGVYSKLDAPQRAQLANYAAKGVRENDYNWFADQSALAITDKKAFLDNFSVSTAKQHLDDSHVQQMIETRDKILSGETGFVANTAYEEKDAMVRAMSNINGLNPVKDTGEDERARQDLFQKQYWHGIERLKQQKQSNILSYDEIHSVLDPLSIKVSNTHWWDVTSWLSHDEYGFESNPQPEVTPPVVAQQEQKTTPSPVPPPRPLDQMKYEDIPPAEVEQIRRALKLNWMSEDPATVLKAYRQRHGG